MNQTHNEEIYTVPKTEFTFFVSVQNYYDHSMRTHKCNDLLEAFEFYSSNIMHLLTYGYDGKATIERIRPDKKLLAITIFNP